MAQGDTYRPIGPNDRLIFDVLGNCVGIQTPNATGADMRINAGQAQVLPYNTAAANAAIIQSVLDSSATHVVIDYPGTITINPILIPSGKTLVVGRSAQTVLKRADGINAPLIRNKWAGQRNMATRFNRVSGVVTVNNRLHGRNVGDQFWVANLTDTTMHGLVTVSAATLDSWSYLSAGSDGAGGAANVYGSIIPIRRTLAGSAFVSASNIVTVSDPGHTFRPGMQPFLCTTGASTAFTGQIKVIAVSADTWTYQTSGAGTGSATGTIGLSYDHDIYITGAGRIDGNRANNTTTQDVDIQKSIISLGNVSHGRIDVAAVRSTDFRAVNLFNCTDFLVRDVEFGDCLVGSQFEGSGDGCYATDITGSTGVWTTGTQTLDDLIAFSGVRTIGGQLYDSTASPYGLGSFINFGAKQCSASNALNGVKLTFDASVWFDNMVCEDIQTGIANQNSSPLGNGTSAVRMTDDSPGLTGMVGGRVTINRCRGSGHGLAVLWQSTGSLDQLSIDGLIYVSNSLAQLAANTGTAIWLQGGTANANGHIRNLRLSGISMPQTQVEFVGSLPGASSTTLTVSTMAAGPSLVVGMAIYSPIDNRYLGKIQSFGTGTGGTGTYTLDTANAGAALSSVAFIAVSGAVNKPAIVFGNGQVRTTQTLLIENTFIDNYDLVAGNNASGSAILKYGNCNMLNVTFGKNGVIRGPTAGTGIGITCYGPASTGRWTYNGRTTAGGTSTSPVALGFLFNVVNADASDTAASGTELILDGADITATNVLYDNATNWTGTMAVRLSGGTRATLTGNLIAAATATGLIQVFSDQSVSVTADKIAGSLAGTLRVNGTTMQLAGSKVTAPQPGDIFWSTDTSTSGSASIGMKARTNAGAWTALF